jgi:hypothetical protein
MGASCVMTTGRGKETTEHHIEYGVDIYNNWVEQTYNTLDLNKDDNIRLVYTKGVPV